MAEPMPFADKVFVLVSGAFIAVFSTGLFVWFGEHDALVGILLSVLGVIGMSASLLVRSQSARDTRQRNYTLLNLVIALLIFALVVGDILHRRSGSSSALARAIANQDFQEADRLWGEADKHLVVSDKADLSHQDILLDGRYFTNCKTDDTILRYNGTLPSGFQCSGPVNSITLNSDNPAIKQALALAMSLCNVAVERHAPIKMQERPELPPVTP